MNPFRDLCVVSKKEVLLYLWGTLPVGLPAGRALAQLLKIEGPPFFHHLTRRPSFHRTRPLTRDAASGLNPCEWTEPVKLRSCERGDGRKGCNQSHSVEGWITHPKCNSLKRSLNIGERGFLGLTKGAFISEMLILERESSILLLVVIVEFLSIGLTIKLYRNCEQMTATFQVKTVMAESLVSIGDSAIFVIYMNNSGSQK